MSEPYTLDAIQEEASAFKAKRDAATPGPWYSADCISPRLLLYHATDDKSMTPISESYCDGKGISRRNMDFIAASRSTELPEMVEWLMHKFREWVPTPERFMCFGHSSSLMNLHRDALTREQQVKLEERCREACMIHGVPVPEHLKTP